MGHERLHADAERHSREGASDAAESTHSGKPEGSAREERLGSIKRVVQRLANGTPASGRLASMAQALGAAPVQADGGSGRATDEGAVHRAAQSGVSGGGGSLPHAGAIQTSFGHHDVSGVRAHVGGAAATSAQAIGAQAYATGDDVAFRSSPDLRQAAHEAAHVVQQRGGVRLDGGVGQSGDRYERHADAVAERVVRGESTESLLDTMAHRGAAGGPAVQRIDFDGDGRDDGAARTPEQVTELVRAAIAAIAQNESGGAAQAVPSRMGTSAQVPASYASSTQMVAPHAVSVLRGTGGGLPAESRQRRRDFATEHGLSQEELADAERIMHASQRIWDAVVAGGASIESLDPRDVTLTGFTPEELGRMFRFGQLRRHMLSQRERYGQIEVAVTAHLTAQADRIAAEIAALRTGGTQPAPSAGNAPAGGDTEAAATEAPATEPATPATEETPAATEGDAGGLGAQAIAATADSRLGAAAMLKTFALPANWEQMRASQKQQWLTRQTRRLGQARRAIARAATRSAESFLAHELAANEHATALGLTEGTLRAYIHEGRFNRFPEDRQAWNRVALSHNMEREGQGGGAPRTLDAAIASAAEADGGHALSNLEFDTWIRNWISQHPTSNDEAVVRAAAAHNGHSPEYPDRIWSIYQSQHAASTPAQPAP